MNEPAMTTTTCPDCGHAHTRGATCRVLLDGDAANGDRCGCDTGIGGPYGDDAPPAAAPTIEIEPAQVTEEAILASITPMPPLVVAATRVEARMLACAEHTRAARTRCVACIRTTLSRLFVWNDAALDVAVPIVRAAVVASADDPDRHVRWTTEGILAVIEESGQHRALFDAIHGTTTPPPPVPSEDATAMKAALDNANKMIRNLKREVDALTARVGAEKRRVAEERERYAVLAAALRSLTGRKTVVGALAAFEERKPKAAPAPAVPPTKGGAK